MILMGDGEPDLGAFAGPVLRARLAPASGDVAGCKVFAFAGIGRPEKFRQTLIAANADVVGWQMFPDHYVYGQPDLEALRQSAARMDATLVTTRKDFVRIDADAREGISVFDVELKFDDPTRAEALLDSLPQPAAVP